MKALLFYTHLLVFICTHAWGQDAYSDSLKNELRIVNSDTEKINILGRLGLANTFSNPDTSLKYTSEGLQVAERVADPYLIAKMQIQMCNTLAIKGNFPLALNYGQTAQRFFEESGDSINMAYCMDVLQLLYKEKGDFERVLKNEREKGDWRDRMLNESRGVSRYIFAFDKANMPDSVLYYAKKMSVSDFERSGLTVMLGNAYSRKNIKDSALFYYRKSIDLATGKNFIKDIVDSYIGLAALYQKSGALDSVKYYLLASVNEKNMESYPMGKLKSFEMLSQMYDVQNMNDSALFYLKKANVIRDQLFNTQNQNSFNNIFLSSELQKKELEKTRKEYSYRLRQSLLLSGLLILLIAVGLLIWNVKQKRRSLELIGHEKKEVEVQRSIAENTLEKLVKTQKQLVQSAKLASLGELTAGIAHEIQNPLNFVNNFSEINIDLMAEMKNEIENGNHKEIKNIATSIEENEIKIRHHGQRAEAIVKSMLQHSRMSSGQYESSNINTLCEEYLRLAFHGMKANDRSFHAVIQTDFDASIGMVNLIPQDIGRVLLNLYNNAFYAVNERMKSAPNGYEPQVKVSTRQVSSSEKSLPSADAALIRQSANSIIISVKDNGTGIPEMIKDKIFQPFFTTKPSGLGTGLGLSLSYDIIKAHGGDIWIDSESNAYTVFNFDLPV